MRNPYFDNAKFILILCIVLCHALAKTNSNNYTVEVFYFYLCSFPVPCFFLAAGYFAKPDKNKKLMFIQSFMLYIVFQLIFMDSSSSITLQTLFTPKHVMWFALVLMYYRLTLPFLKGYLKPIIVIAVITSILFGNIYPVVFELGRAIYYLPFFLVGYMARVNNFKFDFSSKLKYFSAAVFCIVLFIYYYVPASRVIFNEDNMISRAALYFVMTVMSYCFFTLTPKAKTFYSQYGQNTLYVYLLHLPLVVEFSKYTTSPLLLVVGAVIITVILSTAPVKAIAWPFVEPHRVMFKAVS